MFDGILSKFIIKNDLTKLNFSPKHGGLIYHYCDDKTMWSMCSKKSIWLSSIFNMNDSKELIWGREILLKILKNNKNIFQPDFRAFIILSIYNVDGNLLPLIASFSKNGDLLSQWRAYADDARGFSIGFDEEIISNVLPVNTKSVLYAQDEQEELVLNSLKIFNKFWSKHQDKDLGLFFDVLNEFSIDLASLKNPSFSEEMEVRIIHLLVKDQEKGTWIDKGGHNVRDEHISGVPVLSRESNNQQVPYIEMPLIKSEIINKVIIGSKNPSSISDVREKLCSLGLENVIVIQSSSTYQ